MHFQSSFAILYPIFETSTSTAARPTLGSVALTHPGEDTPGYPLYPIQPGQHLILSMRHLILPCEPSTLSQVFQASEDGKLGIQSNSAANPVPPVSSVGTRLLQARDAFVGCGPFCGNQRTCSKCVLGSAVGLSPGLLRNFRSSVTFFVSIISIEPSDSQCKIIAIYCSGTLEGGNPKTGRIA